jgi:hypothetical protein
MGGMNIESQKATPTGKDLNLLNETTYPAQIHGKYSATGNPVEANPNDADQINLLGIDLARYKTLPQAQKEYFIRWFKWVYEQHSEPVPDWTRQI